MKKVLTISLALICLCISAHAQLRIGGQFAINVDKARTAYTNGSNDTALNNLLISLKPKIYWNLNEKMQIGGRIGWSYGNMLTGTVTDSGSVEKDLTNLVTGWSICPFFGYKLLQWGKVGIWAEANCFVGQDFNIGQEILSAEWSKVTAYGFQILPVLDIDLTEKLALQLHLGFISLGWSGANQKYSDRENTISSLDLHKGGFLNLLQGFRDYGIGLVRKF